ncbi:CRAL/TRIO domain-containing protein [Sodiomyces alkalinus F11]|uniref:Phosphatidylinositol transfer protein SFH5 n=1 Tax=Sodiomyces alkalinus (strain CBS 110278 / VKM F-3762 / F11) TaxID=1314773 RepID=A0A3N2QAM6_SODAK|nr:CRAL/TRIO domain-containing protein [Sodiomyces alkalinus F11]ROT43786.1 CRAL/TRIO domain-containing protein [Sodiomyces alkalinus F11]
MADEKPQTVPEAQTPAENKPESETAPETAKVDDQPGTVAESEAAAVVPSAEPSGSKEEGATQPSAPTPAADSTEAKEEPAKEETKEVTQDEAKEPEDKKDETKVEPASATTAEATTDAAKEDGEPPASPIQQLWAAAQEHKHGEIWGVDLADPETHIPSQIVFQKYLNANDGVVAKAKDQLVKTLDWRAEAKPLELVGKAFSKTKFDGLGYVTTYSASEGGTDPEKREVFTWNIYGAAVKRVAETFGDLNEFIEWRVALMELALQSLNIKDATTPITADKDPYKIYQVHDYQSISFLRQAPEVKAASTKTISVFAQNYPELLREKFFVNVPAIMGFMYAFFKLFVAAKTAKKFHPLSSGASLARELAESPVDGLGEKLPLAYGGKGGELASQGRGPELA